MLRNCIGIFRKSVENGCQKYTRTSYHSYHLILLITCISLLSLTACGTNTGTTETSTSIPPETAASVPPGTITEDTIGGGTGNATLGWTAPITNADGTTLTDLAGFKVYYGNVLPLSKGSSPSIDVGNITNAVLDGLENGMTHFTVTAYDTSGNESNFSEVVSKIIS